MSTKFTILLLLLLAPAYLLAQTPCSGGTAGTYDCDGITLQSYISAATMGGTEGQDSWGWTDVDGNGDEYAIVGMDNGTAFVNITDPINPIFLGRLESQTGSSLWRDVKTYQNYAYIVSDANGNHGMQVFDLTNLRGLDGSPIVTFNNDAWVTWGTSGSNRGRAHNIIINEDTGFAYVLGVSPFNSGGPVFFRLDGNNNGVPNDPVQVGRFSSLGYCHDAQVVTYDGPDPDHQGKEIFIGSFSSSNRIHILDVSNKNSVQQIATISYPNPRYTHQGWFTEDKKFFILGDELDESQVGYDTRTMVFDFTDLDSPQMIVQYEGPTAATDHNGYVRGNRFYLANYTAGVRILKLDRLYESSPELYEVDFFDTFRANNNAGTVGGIWNVYPYFESGNLIATGFSLSSTTIDNGLFILKDPNYDNEPPVANCDPYTATLNKATGSVTITADDLAVGATDNIGITEKTITSGQTTFTCADVGTTFNVTIELEDDYGLKTTCTRSVTVEAEETSYLGGDIANNASWTNGVPGVGSDAKIAANATLTAASSVDACTCQIDNARTLTIAADGFLKTENDITVNGTLNIQHQGSLVQTDPTAQVIKNGTINVGVTTPVLQTRDFMIMGSPMDAETRDGVFQTPFLVLDFTPANFIPHPDIPAGGTNFADDDGDYYNQINGATPITPGYGYVVRPQDSYTDPANEAYDFNYSQGTLKNGTVIHTAMNNGPTDNPGGTPNVVANPYPSAIDGDLFMTTNGLNALYIWEHLTPPGEGLPGSNLRFDMDDLSIRNLGMGIPAANDPGTSTTPNGVISTAQGFAIRTNGADGTTQDIEFNNTMRLTSGNNTLRNTDETESILLEVRNDDYRVGGFTGIAFNESATNDLDLGYDTNRLATVISIYSHLDDGSEQLGIQSRAPLTENTEIKIGFSSQVDAILPFEISLANIQGTVLENTIVYLIDLQEDIITNLTEEDGYTFLAGKETINGRFLLRFEPEVILGQDMNDSETIVVYPNPTKNRVTINSPNSFIKNIQVFDVRGRRMAENIDEDTHVFSIELASLETGIYFITITTDNGMVTRKIIKE